jgi:hypothetical protein
MSPAKTTKLLIPAVLAAAFTLAAAEQQVAAKKNLEPAISRPAQEKAAAERLGALKQKYEGGVRVPGIAYWKGTIKPGRVSHGLFDAKEEHAMMPLKQPHGPVILGTVNKHLATFKAYPPAVPML